VLAHLDFLKGIFAIKLRQAGGGSYSHHIVHDATGQALGYFYFEDVRSTLGGEAAELV